MEEFDSTDHRFIFFFQIENCSNNSSENKRE